jgi:hypothetical protein
VCRVCPLSPRTRTAPIVNAFPRSSSSGATRPGKQTAALTLSLGPEQIALNTVRATDGWPLLASQFRMAIARPHEAGVSGVLSVQDPRQGCARSRMGGSSGPQFGRPARAAARRLRNVGNAALVAFGASLTWAFRELSDRTRRRGACMANFIVRRAIPVPTLAYWAGLIFTLHHQQCGR